VGAENSEIFEPRYAKLVGEVKEKRKEGKKAKIKKERLWQR